MLDKVKQVSEYFVEGEKDELFGALSTLADEHPLLDEDLMDDLEEDIRDITPYNYDLPQQDTITYTTKDVSITIQRVNKVSQFRVKHYGFRIIVEGK